MKIAVVTIHRVHNYGTVLQAVATQRVLERAGHEVCMVDYITERRRLRNQLMQCVKKGKGSFRKSQRAALKMVSVCIRELYFDRFLRKHLNLTKPYVTVEDLCNDPPQADIYVTGSDQTWNSYYNKGVDPGYFLSFAPEGAMKVAYAASFGRESLDDAECVKTKPYIDQYKYLSVREDTGLQILKQLGRTDGVHILDPTLQLKGSFWKKMAGKPVHKKPYVLLFLIYDEDRNGTEIARKIADAKGIELVKVSWELKTSGKVDKLYTHKSPEAFLSLVSHAAIVVTNSFHCMALSINMHKQFLVVPRLQFNTRIESLLRQLQLESRVIPEEVCVDVDHEYLSMVIQEANIKIDYPKVEAILTKERKNAEAYIDIWRLS